MKIAFLGAGNMGSALIQGAIRSGHARASSIYPFDTDAAKLRSLSKACGVRPALNSRTAVENAPYVFLCVKPQQIKTLLKEIKGWLKKDQCVISIAAGVSSSTIEKNLGQKISVVRVMPNTPVLIQCGATAIAKGRYAAKEHVLFAQRFFASVGKALILPEKEFDAVTAVSGSGPAYLFYLAESLEDAGKKLGLAPRTAKILSFQTLLGATKMLERNPLPKELRQNVTSPGGTTECGIRYLQNHHWTDTFIEAVKRARDRSKELSVQFGG